MFLSRNTNFNLLEVIESHNKSLSVNKTDEIVCLNRGTTKTSTLLHVTVLLVWCWCCSCLLWTELCSRSSTALHTGECSRAVGYLEWSSELAPLTPAITGSAGSLLTSWNPWRLRSGAHT